MFASVGCLGVLPHTGHYSLRALQSELEMLHSDKEDCSRLTLGTLSVSPISHCSLPAWQLAFQELAYTCPEAESSCGTPYLGGSRAMACSALSSSTEPFKEA